MEDFFKYALAALVAVIGWWVVHYFNSKRDRLNKRRELSIQHLINAYKVLTDEIAHRDLSNDAWRKLELIVTEIQLFGSEEQVKMAQSLAREVAAKTVFELDPLINNLRNSLRKQLELSEISGNVTWLRYTPFEKKKVKSSN